jgi:hypothetical protein
MKKITVVIAGNNNHDMMKFSIETTLKNLPEWEDVIVFGDRPVIDYGQFVQLPADFSKDAYNQLCLKGLFPYIKTDFVLVIQHDGMAVNSCCWNNDFYNYDYIGPAWSDKFSWVGPTERVGNGGFSLRSLKLLSALQDPGIVSSPGARTNNEDAVICQGFASYLKSKYMINYAPVELADQFGHEWNNFTGNTFGFHGVFNSPLYFNQEDTMRFLNSDPTPNHWYNDQLHKFIQLCSDKNYVDVLAKLENILYKKEQP